MSTSPCSLAGAFRQHIVNIRCVKIVRLAYLPPQPETERASYGSVRTAVERARQGVATQIEGNVGMSAEQAANHARSLLQGDTSVRLRVDGIWLHVEPYI
jgi:hypothetical protein